MKLSRLYFGLLGVLTALWMPAAPAHAQATRTWVSGVGDDVNPCSRTAPCKTFAGAISKTAAAGEINVLDPGGFGAVTITKSITISSESPEAGVLVSGTNGIVVSGAGIVVRLRGLDIEGLGTGLAGVNFLAGAALYVEKCTIHGFNAGSATGISFAPASSADLFVTDTSIYRNGIAGSPGTGGGIVVAPSGGTVGVTVGRSHIDGNSSAGIKVSGGAFLTLENSTVSRNFGDGITAGSSTTVMIDRSLVNYNTAIGVNANAAGAVARIGNSTLQANGTSAASSNGGTVQSFQNNQISGNTNDNTPLPAFPGPGGPLQ